MSGPTDPLESLYRLMVHNSRDWGQERSDAWLYGVVVGWDDPEDDPKGEAMTELARAHGWDEIEVARLRMLHEKFQAMREPTP